MNNYYGSDFAGPGAVDRPGIAALDPTNGMPFSWNPAKDRGTGVFACPATNDGLWMGSDTDHIAGETHRKIAFFPLAGGKTPPPTDPYTLPGDLYNVPTSSCQGVDPSILYRVNAGGPSVGSAGLRAGLGWPMTPTARPAPPIRNSGSNSAGPWGQQFTVDGTVPATTPSTIFDTRAVGPGRRARDAVELPGRLRHPPAGPPVPDQPVLRAPRSVGQRVFNVTIDGNTVLNNYDIVADVGDRVGTMKSFNITSDGNVDIDFSHCHREPARQWHRDHRPRCRLRCRSGDDQLPAAPGVRWIDARDHLEPQHAGHRLEHHPRDLRAPRHALQRLDRREVLRQDLRRLERRSRAADRPARADGLPGPEPYRHVLRERARSTTRSGATRTCTTGTSRPRARSSDRSGSP